MNFDRIIEKSKASPEEKSLISVKLPKDLKDKLSDLADKNDITVTAIVVTLIDEFFNGELREKANREDIARFKELIDREKNLMKLIDDGHGNYDSIGGAYFNLNDELANTRYLLKKLRDLN